MSKLTWRLQTPCMRVPPDGGSGESSGGKSEANGGNMQAHFVNELILSIAVLGGTTMAAFSMLDRRRTAIVDLVGRQRHDRHRNREFCIEQWKSSPPKATH